MKKYLNMLFRRPDNAIGWRLFCLAALFPVLARAQAPELGVWSEVNVQKWLDRSIALNVNAQVRMNHNLGNLQALAGEAGVTYRPNKHWLCSAYYRYMGKLKRDEDDESYTRFAYHRFYADVSFRYKIWNLKYSHRLRYQHQFKEDAGSQPVNKSYLRNRFAIAYATHSRFTPYVSTDVFFRINEGFNQMRNRMGVEYNVTRYQQLDLFCFTDYQLAGRQKNELILGVKYQIEL